MSCLSPDCHEAYHGRIDIRIYPGVLWKDYRFLNTAPATAPRLRISLIKGNKVLPFRHDRQIF